MWTSVVLMSTLCSVKTVFLTLLKSWGIEQRIATEWWLQQKAVCFLTVVTVSLSSQNKGMSTECMQHRTKGCEYEHKRDSVKLHIWDSPQFVLGTKPTNRDVAKKTSEPGNCPRFTPFTNMPECGGVCVLGVGRNLPSKLPESASEYYSLFCLLCLCMNFVKTIKS